MSNCSLLSSVVISHCFPIWVVVQVTGSTITITISFTVLLDQNMTPTITRSLLIDGCVPICGRSWLLGERSGKPVTHFLCTYWTTSRTNTKSIYYSPISSSTSIQITVTCIYKGIRKIMGTIISLPLPTLAGINIIAPSFFYRHLCSQKWATPSKLLNKFIVNFNKLYATLMRDV